MQLELTRRSIVAAFVFFVLVLGVRLPAAPLGGFYDCEGTAPNGPYHLTLQLRLEPHDTVRLAWLDNGQETARGIGVLVDRVLAAAYATVSGWVGVVVYRVGEDRLEGVWTAELGERFTEVCTRGGHPA